MSLPLRERRWQRAPLRPSGPLGSFNSHHMRTLQLILQEGSAGGEWGGCPIRAPPRHPRVAAPPRVSIGLHGPALVCTGQHWSAWARRPFRTRSDHSPMPTTASSLQSTRVRSPPCSPSLHLSLSPSLPPSLLCSAGPFSFRGSDPGQRESARAREREREREREGESTEQVGNPITLDTQLHKNQEPRTKTQEHRIMRPRYAAVPDRF